MNKLRVFEAFAGYGSQSIALRNLGIPHEVVAISEIDKYAIKAYEAIHEPTLNLGDISKIKVEDIPEHDLFTYSFPCVDLSVAGKQAGLGKGTRSGLLYECKKIIEHCRPKYLLLENVKNLVGKKFKPQFDEWLTYLESLGYTSYWKVLNAKDYGVPQNRERVFVVSILGDHKPYKFADKIPLDKCIADILEDKVDEKYYINKLFHLANKGHQAELNTKGMDCIKSYIEYKGKKIELPCIGASRGRNPKNPSSRIPGEPTEQRLEINTKGISNTITTVQKDNYVIEPKIICEQRCNERLRFFKDNVCGTIRAKDSGGDKRIIESTYRIRKLTPRECFRLMGLKDDDIDKIQQAGISNAQQYKMAGNSIVVDVLEAIFKNLFLD